MHNLVDLPPFSHRLLCILLIIFHPYLTAVATPAPLTADTVQSEAFSTLLEDGQRREEQVELLRDRKTLDLESTILKARKAKMDEFAKK